MRKRLRLKITRLLTLPLPLSFASTLKSSSVVVSPVTAFPLATSFSRRRMIFPLRVFGSASAKRISSGLAIAPMCMPTCSRNSVFSEALAVDPALQGDERDHALAFQFIRPADHGGFRDVARD